MAGIPVGSGLASQLVVKDEVTYGVAPSLTSGVDSFEFNSETLELKKTTVQGQGLAAGKLYPRTKRRVLTNYDVSGDIIMDLPTRNLGYWLRYMIGDFTETPTQMGTTGVYQTVFNPKSTQFGHSFCVQKGVPTADNATVEPFTYVGNKLSGWSVNVAVGAISTLTLNVDGRNELAGAFPNGGITASGDPLNAATPALATFATPTTGLGTSVFHFKQATLYTGGTPTLASGVTSLVGETAAGNIKDATLGQTFGFDNSRIFVGSSGFKAEQIEDTYRAITGSFTVEWLSSEAYYNAFAADSVNSLELKWVGSIGGTSGTNTYLLDIIIPNIRLEGESVKVPGPAVLTQQINFTGTDDEATTPIQATYQSEDSTF